MELEQLEALALSADREQALAKLIPGTEDYYFHRCLELLHHGELAATEPLFEAWVQRHGETARVRELRDRRALLAWDTDPEGTREHLRRRLSVTFTHQREVDQADSNLATRLDPALISRERLEVHPLRQHNLDGIGDRALGWLVRKPEVRRNLNLLRSLLRRVDRPTAPELVDLIAHELDDSHSSGFGSFSIHTRLTLAQLDALAERRPDLREHPTWVDARVARLLPGPDVDLDDDLDARADHLDRLWGFVQALAPSFNSLKAHVLYHQLELDRRRDACVRERFERYIQLPRDTRLLPTAQRQRHQYELAQLGQDFRATTGLAPVADDVELITEILEVLFADPAVDDHRGYATWLDETYLRRVFAETKILAGVGDAERWYSLLDDPGYYKTLEDRVAIKLVRANPRRWAADAAVELIVDLQRVPTLVVKVFEINTLAYFLAHGREVDSGVDLDGLVANDERVLELDAPALRRVRHTLRFDDLTRPGTFVIELIGNGKSSRALIRKGALRYVERRTAAGHALSIVDADGQLVTEPASVWFAGREFEPEQAGAEIRIPYGAGGQDRLLLRCGSLASIVPFTRAAERYQLHAGIHVEREQLIAGATAEVVVGATLTLAGTPIDVSLLREPQLLIHSVDRDGIDSSATVPLTLSDAREAVHTFKVPDALRRLSFTLTAKVRSLTEQRDIDLEAESSVVINELDSSAEVADVYLSKTAGGYLIHVLGKSGEPRAGVEVGLAIGHLEFRARTNVRLQTDAHGRIELGELVDIETVVATLGTGRSRTWSLRGADFEIAAELHAVAGRELVLPRPPGASVAEVVSLFELRGSHFVRDRSDALTLADDALIVAGLEPGDYQLSYELEGRTTRIRVAPAVGARGWAVGPRRLLELSRAESLRIRAIELDGDEHLRIELGGVRPGTRVHVFGRRLLPSTDAHAALDHPRRTRAPFQRAASRVRSTYLSGRDIGDEYRYILDRKRADPLPGNMLERPGLLLNPWALRTTSTGVATAATGGAYASMRDEAEECAEDIERERGYGAAATSSSNLDFLAAPASVILNLEPVCTGDDQDGHVMLTRAELGDATLIRVVAVDRSSQVATELALPESAIATRDRRLLDALDPRAHFVLRKRRACLVGDAELVLDDVRTAKLEAVDSLTKAHGLLVTSTDDPQLREFEFLTRWPTLSPSDQADRYSKYACHELDLFLARKDPEFFAAVVRPYLANKRDPTFLDHYLLGDELDAWLEPWAYARLNALEKALLAERIPDERGPSSRHLGDRVDLLPPDVEGDRAAFDTALQGSALADRPSMIARGGGGEGMDMFAAGGGPMAAAAPAPRSMSTRAGGPMPPPAPAPAPKRARKQSARPPEPSPMERSAKADRGDLAAREQVRRFFQPVDKTQEWAENNYYRRRISEQGAELIPVNKFWRDFAEHVAAGSPGPFLSGEFLRATSSLAEMLCALAVLDLPFTPVAPTQRVQGVGAVLRANSPMIVFHEQIAAVAETTEPLGVLVSQNYFRADDRYRFENNEQHDKYVGDELLVHTVYVCQIVLTNPSSSAHVLELLAQIPRGAVPVQDGFETRDLHVHLPPRGTHATEYAFYFPAPGRFEHFPIHVAKHEALVVFAEPRTLEVVTRLRSVDTESWSHVSQHGDDAELLAFLEANNIDRLALERIAWRMRDRDLFEATLALLRRRRVYSEVLWSYALHHGDPVALGEYLRQQDGFVRGCGLALDTTLVQTDPVERRWYQHLEYAPLVNARAHQLGSRRKILNSALEAQYRAFLQTLTYVAAPTDDQLVAAASYALVQDRVRDGFALLDRVAPDRVQGTLQWDYLQAYVALYRADLGLARTLAERHHEHPVPRWRNKFETLLAMLAEAEGEAATVIDADDRQQQQAQLAATEASFDFEVEDDSVVISHRNLGSCRLSFYRMDIELLFSRQPFMQDQSDRFAIVQPNYSVELELGQGALPLRVELPAELRSANAIVEVLGAGVRRSKANYAHDLAVRVVEQYGQLRVSQRTSAGALARAYVKVYARKQGGSVEFYKDGYTDFRGAFDYASLSTNELDHVERFAILVSSPEHGALIREVAPPKR